LSHPYLFRGSLNGEFAVRKPVFGVINVFNSKVLTRNIHESTFLEQNATLVVYALQLKESIKNTSQMISLLILT
jgi:hypothetical protein